jgi:gas vesicle protein
MSEKNGTKILLAFIAGAAVGAAIGYFLNSDKKEEILNDLKEGASRLKNDIEENLNNAKDLVDGFRKENTGGTTENQES